MLMRPVDGELQLLQHELLALGSVVGDTFFQLIDILKRRDLAGAQRLITLDQRIHKKRFSIEMDCLTLIATQRPLDGDLRAAIAILEIATELERMGNSTNDTIGSPFMIIDGSLLNVLDDIHRMASKTQDLLHRTLQAFTQNESSLTQAIPAVDYEVNVLYNQIYQELLSVMQKDSGTNSGSRAIVNQARYLARIARNLKRCIKQVITIYQWVIFAVSDDIVEIERTEGARLPASAHHSTGLNQISIKSAARDTLVLEEDQL
jgi:phosphate transport system protein